MGDIGDFYRETKELRKEISDHKKKSNIKSSTEMLVRNGIEFEEKNCGVHLVVNHNGKTADFWPSTGKFCIRGTEQYKRGVRLLISILRAEDKGE